VLDDAIAKICKTRSYFGACQNRLEHTYKNNANAHENITNAESRIRDTDMAEEMINQSKWKILNQAGLSMLSQANQLKQGILSLIA
ncbi:MAG: flagellin, partial [Eubacterium sp.]|nr:flagellin [Eubacterium sp.]